jgi:hypothetical protein
MAALELARAETAMDVAVLGEIRDGREVARGLAGDAQSFGLTIGSLMALEDTNSERLLAGRLGNIVHDARADERVRDLELTREARIGAYVGVPLTRSRLAWTSFVAWRTSSGLRYRSVTCGSCAVSARRSSRRSMPRPPNDRFPAMSKPSAGDLPRPRRVFASTRRAINAPVLIGYGRSARVIDRTSMG